jgi:hypothetical protein
MSAMTNAGNAIVLPSDYVMPERTRFYSVNFNKDRASPKGVNPDSRPTQRVMADRLQQLRVGIDECETSTQVPRTPFQTTQFDIFRNHS